MYGVSYGEKIYPIGGGGGWRALVRVFLVRYRKRDKKTHVSGGQIRKTRPIDGFLLSTRAVYMSLTIIVFSCARARRLSHAFIQIELCLGNLRKNAPQQFCSTIPYLGMCEVFLRHKRHYWNRGRGRCLGVRCACCLGISNSFSPTNMENRETKLEVFWEPPSYELSELWCVGSWGFG